MLRRLFVEILDAVVVGLFVAALWHEWWERYLDRKYCEHHG